MQSMYIWKFFSFKPRTADRAISFKFFIISKKQEGSIVLSSFSYPLHFFFSQKMPSLIASRWSKSRVIRVTAWFSALEQIQGHQSNCVVFSVGANPGSSE